MPSRCIGARDELVGKAGKGRTTYFNCLEKSSAASSSSQLSSHRCSFPPLAADPAACSASSWGQSVVIVSADSKLWLLARGCDEWTYSQRGNLQTRHLLPKPGASFAVGAGPRARPCSGWWNWTWSVAVCVVCVGYPRLWERLGRPGGLIGE